MVRKTITGCNIRIIITYTIDNQNCEQVFDSRFYDDRTQFWEEFNTHLKQIMDHGIEFTCDMHRTLIYDWR